MENKENKPMAEDAPLTAKELEVVEKVKEINNEITSTKTFNAYWIGVEINSLYSKKYGEDRFGLLAEEIGISKSTLYKYRDTADEFSDEDIDILCFGGNFPLAFKDIKNNLKFGREKIMEIFSKSKTPKDFKEAFEKLRAEEKENESKKGNSATPVPSEKTGTNEGEIKDYSTPSASNNENCPPGTNLPASEEKSSSNPDIDPDDNPSEGQNDDGKPNSQDELGENKPSVPDNDPKSEPDEEELQEATPTETQDLSAIKQKAGSDTDICPPANNDGDTLAKMMGKKFPTNPSDPGDGTTTIAKSRLAQLEKLEKEYGDLKTRFDELEQEKKVLEQEKDELEEKLYDLEEKLSEAQRVEEFAHM